MIHENFPAAVQARRPALVRRRRSPAIDMAARFLHIKITICSHGMTSVFFQGWMGSGYNLDPAKIGQEGYNLLKYYEQQLKALQVGHTYTIIHTLLWFKLHICLHHDNETNMQPNNWASILMLHKLGRVEHKSDEAVQWVQGGVDRQDQGGQERGQGKT